MSERTSLTVNAVDKATYAITAQILDETGAPIAASSLTTLVLTLYDAATGTIINTADHVSILNTGRGAIDASGNLIITLTPADNALLGTDATEYHAALIEWTYATGTKQGRHEVSFAVVNFAKV